MAGRKPPMTAKLARTIRTKDGGVLRTRGEAANYMTGLPEQRSRRRAWQAAARPTRRCGWGDAHEPDRVCFDARRASSILNLSTWGGSNRHASICKTRERPMIFADMVFEKNRYENYQALTRVAEEEIRRMLSDAEILPDISSRTKSIKSINDKIERKNYADFQSQMKDISGIRIVCMTQRQKEHVVERLKEHFEVIEHEPSTSDPYSMGYIDEKLILALGNKYSDRTYESIRRLPFEVQIRFVFMDAWAKFSHAFAYTEESNIPPVLLRKIHIMSAASEMLDDLVDAYADRLSSLQTEIKTELESNEAKYAATPVNMETLQAYIEVKFPGKPINRRIQSLVLRDFNRERYRTIADIDRAVDAAKPFLDWYSERAPAALFAGGADYITKGLGWTDLEFRRKHAFGKDTRKAFDEFDASSKNRR